MNSSLIWMFIRQQPKTLIKVIENDKSLLQDFYKKLSESLEILYKPIKHLFSFL